VGRIAKLCQQQSTPDVHNKKA